MKFLIIYLNILVFNEMNCNSFFIFCHQDDEFGLFNVIENATQKQKNVFVIYLTTGLKNKNENNKIKLQKRDLESIKILLKLNIKKKNIIFLGKKLNIPVYKLSNYLNEAYQKIIYILKKNKGKHIIYTHAWEGGNEDHDACYVIVKKILCNNIKVIKCFEFSQYHNYRTKIFPFKVHKFISDKRKIYRTKINFYNKLRYIRYLFNYFSQLYIWFPIFPFIIIRIFMNDYGNLKIVKTNLNIKKPHRGILLYEKLRLKKYSYFKKFFLNFLSN